MWFVSRISVSKFGVQIVLARDIASVGTLACVGSKHEELQARVGPEAEQEHILSIEELQAQVGTAAEHGGQVGLSDLQFMAGK